MTACIMKNSLLVSLLLALGCRGFAQNGSDKLLPQLGKNTLQEVVGAMTLEEKAKMVVGMGFRMPGMPPPSANRKDTGTNVGGFRMPPSDPDAFTVPEKVPGAAGRTHAIARLGIPSITVSDGPAGVRISPFRNNDSSRSYFATAFPVATLLASSWDTSLLYKVGVAFGREIHEYGVDIILGPALNIHRNPLGGRNFEYYSEDPLVAGEITSAIVKGIQSNGVGTSIKHFAANNQETNRNTINTIVSERALREIYLKGFEIAVKNAQPWTVMTSYNKINGTYTSERRDLVTNILRDEWGFKGLVMTDWFGGRDAVGQMKAGNDLLMPGNPNQSKAIVDAVTNGSLDQRQLDLNVKRILQIILKSPEFKKYKYSSKPDLAKDAQVARWAAAESMVLLKNTGTTLPIAGKKAIAVFGNTSYDLIAGGTGSGDVNKPYTISLMQGLVGAGYTPNPALQQAYVSYLTDAKAKRPKSRNFFTPQPPIPEMAVSDDAIQQAVGSTDAALLTIGRNAGEGADRKLENDFYLSAPEKDLIRRVTDAFHGAGKKVTVILNIGGVVEVASWRDAVDAILLAWQPGLEAGNAIADILSGKVDPSGKLATTFPMDYKDVPSAKNFPGKELVPDTAKQSRPAFGGKPSEVTYEDGIYVGYRYYNTFGVKTAYDFGYGLSYTRFTYGPIKLNASTFNGQIKATLTITNAGQVAGKEVVELYLSAPAKTMDKPSEELKGFAKTKLLKPGESQSLSFVLDAADLASFDTRRAAWLADPGSYQLQVGASSTDIRQKASFSLPKELVTEKVHNLLTPQVPIAEMKHGQ
jgi:beta-glucosidase